VRGNTVEVIPSYDEMAIRIGLIGDRIVKLEKFEPLTGKIFTSEKEVYIYPAKHFVTPAEKMTRAKESIKQELQEQLEYFRMENKPLEAERLEMRTLYDLDMLDELGYCHGIENYSRHLAGRMQGERPEVLLDYFPEDYLIFIDESHVTVPQLKGMFYGDRSRKETLVKFGFRLPSAMDNRPLMFGEFENMAKQVVYVSATPGRYELDRCRVEKIGTPSNLVAEQIIRPTGLIDPPVTVRPTANQIEDLLSRIRAKTEKKQRTLVITVSKNLAEEISDYLKGFNVKVHYLHYEIDTLERVDILQKLREAKFDVLVGINLLREGLDLPEVSLVAILDADKEGFLRSATSLIQISGRAARSIDGEVVMYADRITEAMNMAINETERRRKKQVEYNLANNITPHSIEKPIYKSVTEIIGGRKNVRDSAVYENDEAFYGKDLFQTLNRLEKKMMAAAKKLDFEEAIYYREKIKKLKKEK